MTEPAGISVAELMGALSLSVDLGLGQPMEHGLRTCLLASNLAAAMGLPGDDVAAVYDASLLRFVGCNAERQLVVSFFGDEFAFAKRISPVAQGSTGEIMRAVLGSAGAGRSAPGRLAARVSVVANMKKFQIVDRSHCEVAVLLAERLGFGARIRSTLLHAFDRWDGKEGIAKGEDIPIEMRVAAVAGDAEIHRRIGGAKDAVEVVKRRAGAALDPEVVEAFERNSDDLLAGLESESMWDDVMAVDPRGCTPLNDDDADRGFRACADFADFVSPYLAGHSVGVSRIAGEAARLCGVGDADILQLRRAAYVHEMGRPGISVAVWNKEGPLSSTDWEQVRLHPYYAERALSRSSTLNELASIAALSQERLDGSGYHKGIPAAMLPVGARLLSAADVFRALSEDRPHRAALPKEDVAPTMRDEVKAGRLDGSAVEAVLEAEGTRGRRRSREWPRGLTSREVEVLRLIARGLPTKDIASRLVISNKTVDNHIQHIYEKLSVSTRAAAAMFAIQHDLVELPAER